MMQEDAIGNDYRGEGKGIVMKRLFLWSTILTTVLGCTRPPVSPDAKDKPDPSGPEAAISAGPLANLIYRDLHPVERSDPHWDIVQAEMARITSTDPASPVGNRLEAAGRIEGGTIRTLFPGWEFYAFVYSNYMRKGFDDKKASLAMRLGYTLAVAPNSGETIRLYHYGDYEAYGALLARNKVTISNAEEARLVWRAFCEVHRKGWQNYGIERVSDSEWRLGITSGDQTIAEVDNTKTIVKRTYFTRVLTDPTTHQILAWKSTVETSDKRVERSQ